MLKSCLALAGLAAGTMLALPAAAQDAPPPYDYASDTIVVEGHYDRGGTLPDRVRSASLAVSYADLDLSQPEDRHILKHRINLTARYLCDRLGESGSGSAIPGPSCREATARDAMARVGTAEEGWAPRHTRWVRGPAWHSPYADDWAAKYPTDDY